MAPHRLRTAACTHTHWPRVNSLHSRLRCIIVCQWSKMLGIGSVTFENIFHISSFMMIKCSGLFCCSFTAVVVVHFSFLCLLLSPGYGSFLNLFEGSLMSYNLFALAGVKCKYKHVCSSFHICNAPKCKKILHIHCRYSKSTSYLVHICES